MKRLLLFALLLGLTSQSFAKEEETPEFKEQCTSAREYITAYRYLQEHEEFKISEKNVRKLADQVSKGCSGASKRFIKVVNLMLRAGIDTSTAIKTAQNFINESDEKTNTYTTIFLGSFLKKDLDLSILASRKIALDLTIGMKKDPKIIQKDFTQIANFCARAENLDLAKPQCAQLAVKILKNADDFEAPIAEPFIGTFKFLTTDSRGPRIPTYQALKISEDLSEYGPIATKNFIEGYRHAVSSKGLRLTRSKAIEFGKSLAKLSIKK